MPWADRARPDVSAREMAEIGLLFLDIGGRRVQQDLRLGNVLDETTSWVATRGKGGQARVVTRAACLQGSGRQAA